METRNPNTTYSQQDLRRLMQQHKTKSPRNKEAQTRISSPLAKYDHLGKLHCIICGTVIRSESVWKVHINTKAHKLNVESARRQKDVLLSKPPCSSNNMPDQNETKSRLQAPTERDPFNDTSSVLQTSVKATKISSDEPIPEGFFDDPVKDAKARNTEYKDPKDEEWERFKREIKEESYFSNEIIAGEQDEATADRQLEEIDEQMRKWSRVIQLERKKEIVNKQKQRHKGSGGTVQESLTSDESDSFEEFSDWRSKRF